MIGWLPESAKFFQGLLDEDGRTVDRQRARGCPSCGGRLDRADYPRKPRGLPDRWEGLFDRRFSLCCCREGCRRRVTPPSVRFLGRRVYAGAVVLLGAAVPVLVAIALCGVARCTVARWAAWWTEALPQSAFWRVARARLMPPLDEARLPAELLVRFLGDRDDALFKALVFIAPITAAPRSSSFPMGP
jgi:hypothetical protein